MALLYGGSTVDTTYKTMNSVARNAGCILNELAYPQSLLKRITRMAHCQRIYMDWFLVILIFETPNRFSLFAKGNVGKMLFATL